VLPRPHFSGGNPVAAPERSGTRDCRAFPQTDADEAQTTPYRCPVAGGHRAYGFPGPDDSAIATGTGQETALGPGPFGPDPNTGWLRDSLGVQCRLRSSE